MSWLPSEVGFPLPEMLKDHEGWEFHKANVTGIDLAARTVTAEGMPPVSYDYLMIALGAVVNFFGTKGAAENAFPLYNMREAVKLKEHILERLEAAGKEPALIDDGALTFCVVGGGATGVEISGALAELAAARTEGRLSRICRWRRLRCICMRWVRPCWDPSSRTCRSIRRRPWKNAASRCTWAKESSRSSRPAFI